METGEKIGQYLPLPQFFKVESSINSSKIPCPARLMGKDQFGKEGLEPAPACNKQGGDFVNHGCPF